ncbi:MAG TPA: LytTR family transcriptional regulator DNA-binding domain-containing protein [Gemmatimonadaceae bacterium]|nr:LytTR family transcriptional regulator DNA-binding domain-containing protein [Gemmatimonadaceae bacterium]
MEPRRGRIRAIICDDEPLARDCVRLALAHDGDVEIVAECDEGESAVAAIRQLQPELLFLDVQMPGLDGFDVLAALAPAERPVVVFITAYDAHALRAFEMHALDYLLKPFTDDRFRDAVAHAKEHVRMRGSDLRSRIDQLLRERMREVGEPSGSGDVRRDGPVTRFAVRSGERISMVRAQDVDWFGVDGNYVTLNVRERTFRVRATLRALGEQLDARRFVRIHKSVIVNVERIRELQPWFGGDYVAILVDGRKLRVSRTYAPELLRPIQ